MSKLITPIVKGSFVCVMTPKAFAPDQAPKYSIVLPIEKDDEFLKLLDKKVKEVCMAKWGEVPKKLKMSFKDGDEEEDKYGWAGCRVITASNKTRPGVVVKTEQGLVEPMNDEEIYSGAFYRASIRPYAYEFNKSKGVAISLDNLMKVKDGEKFSARSTPKDDFSEFLDADWE